MTSVMAWRRARASLRRCPLKSTKPVMPHTVLIELPDHGRRISANQSVAGHFPGHHRSGTDDAIAADVRHDDGPLAYPCAGANGDGVESRSRSQPPFIINVLALAAWHADAAAYHRLRSDPHVP